MIIACCQMDVRLGDSAYNFTHAEELVRKAGGVIVGKAAVLAEGEAADRVDIIFLEKLPLFPK